MYLRRTSLIVGVHLLRRAKDNREILFVKLAFHDADTDILADIISRIVARMSQE